jgi:hypothetical protein
MKYIIMIETDVTGDELHEQLCQSAYEGVPLTDCPIQDIQLVGTIEDTLSRDEATEEQIAAVEGAVLSLNNKTN